METADALEKVRAVAEAAEAALVERALKSERELLGTRLLLGLAVVAAVGVPAGVYNGTISLEDAYADRVSGSVTECSGRVNGGFTVSTLWVQCHCIHMLPRPHEAAGAHKGAV